MPKGPFPAHCVQGSPGSFFLKPIASALATAKKAGGNIDIAFKGLHEDIDSFGALPYYEGGDGRIQKDAKLVKETCLACCMGCSQAPWTGSLLMKQSSIIEGMKAGSEGKLDMDAPPDAFACLDDGRPRGLETLPDKLKDCDRIFVCGLALDFCVLDTCLNAVKGKEGAGYNAKQEVHMVLDAARAAHIPGVGTFGSGFLSDPEEVLEKMDTSGVMRTSTEAITGESPYGLLQAKPVFPKSLGPLCLSPVTGLTLVLSATSYTIEMSGMGNLISHIERISRHVHGTLSPKASVPSEWPSAPVGARKLCWAYPLEGIRQSQLSFLALSTSPTLQFAAYGGFLLMDDNDKVLAIQAVASDGDTGGDSAITFGPPRPWRGEFTSQLKDAKRFQPVTLPALRNEGATDFCWINPSETLTAGPESWVPAVHGAFLYLMEDGKAIYFPVEPRVGLRRTLTNSPSTLRRSASKSNIRAAPSSPSTSVHL